MQEKMKIAIIGAGIAGSTAAIYLGKLGLDVTLFERGNSIVSGPPFCHLHAGGNLYREISDEACVTLLKESIELLRMYPQVIDYRPTVLAIPTVDNGEAKDLFKRLDILKEEYKKLVNEDSKNQVLGKVEDYYKVYTKEELKKLKEKKTVKKPKSFDEWMIPVAKNVDLNKIKDTLIMVQEYGLNIFRLSASAKMILDEMSNVKIKLNTTVSNIIEDESLKNFVIEFKNNELINEQRFDYIINAAGFRTGKIDDMLKVKAKRLVEFKSAYVSKWTDCDTIWPEVIFYGTRGTPQGMAQFTPYPNGHFQIHGMTEEITLFKNGLAKSCENSSQPKLEKKFVRKITQGWEKSDIENRTKSAINYIKQFIPSFKNVEVASKPLYGAQQIPGDEVSLRTADVCFESERYARCEIVKASSVLTMSDMIIKSLIELSILPSDVYKNRTQIFDKFQDREKLDSLSKEIAKQRDYPEELAMLINDKKLN
ncbi:FAD-dependent oxidoreductase [Arcobacter arenosus]|uniref:FAD-dependent oxidoreductase n=1 Tax=Arcobacter arenosus TaxID=2576037 RepID=UPI003BA9A637